MDFKFKKVFIADSRTDIRAVIKDSLKDLGITNVVVFNDIDSLIKNIDKEEGLPDWIVCAPLLNDKVTIYGLLSLTCMIEELKDTRVSAIVEESELEFLPSLFELGILSYHTKPFTKQSLTNDLKVLFESFDYDKDKRVDMIAARYLRELLANNEDYKTLLQLESNLAARHPRDGEQLLKLAEAYYFLEDTKGARSILQQAKLLGSSMDIGVKQLASLLGDEEEEEKTFAQALGFESCVLIDSDSSAMLQLEGLIEGLGFKQVTKFDTGEEAYEFIEENREDIDLVISEWRIPKLSLTALIQRLRAKPKKVPSFAVLSSLVKTSDKMMLKELGVVCVLEKPITQGIFNAELASVMKQEALPKEDDVLLRKIRESAQSGDLEETKRCYGILSSNDATAKEILVHAEAYFHFVKEEYSEARKKTLATMRVLPEDATVLNLLGKTLLKLGDLVDAKKVFERANQFSSGNLERLCLLAETNQKLGDEDAANEAIEKSKNIDAENSQVQETNAKVLIERGDTANAKDVMSGLDTVSSVVGYMNNRAVLLIKDNKIEEGLELYRRALKSIPEKNKREQGIIQFNLTLAYIRQNKLQDALESCECITKEHGSKAYAKAQNLLKNVKLAIKHNKTINFSTPPEVVKTDTGIDVPLALHITPGEICLHLIFDSGSFEDASYLSKLEKRPILKL